MGYAVGVDNCGVFTESGEHLSDYSCILNNKINTCKNTCDLLLQLHPLQLQLQLKLQLREQLVVMVMGTWCPCSAVCLNLDRFGTSTAGSGTPQLAL